MNRIISIIILFTMLLAAGCSAPSFTTEIEPSGTKILKGFCERSDIEDDTHFPWFTANYSAYPLDSVTVAEVKPLLDNIHFMVVVGTWCGDSKRELPHFYKIVDALGLSDDEIHLLGVDRSKKSTEGTTDRYTIVRVPTVIVLRGEEEIGRIVEQPRVSLEKDLLKILQK